MNSLRDDLLQIRQAALEAADPAGGVRQALRLESGPHGELLHAGASTWELASVQRLLLVAAGKAAVRMAEAAVGALGERISAGIVVTKSGHAAGHRLPPAIAVHEAGHPTPDHCGLQAAAALYALLDGAGPDDRVLVLLSGGASALLPLPPEGVSLEDLQSLTGILLRAGATINELNTVRKHLDRLKGGQMARIAAPAPVAALALSDVVGDPLETIASGPTVPDPSTFAGAWEVLRRRGLESALTPAVRAHLQAGLDGLIPENPGADDPIFRSVSSAIIGSNRLAALAARRQAEALGYRSLVLSTYIEGEAGEVGRVAAALARGMLQAGDPFPPPACLILGGETTVTVRGMGRGGRNTELALSAAIALEGLPGWALMALATDGTDGPTDSAGGLVDGQTAAAARALGLDPQLALHNHDSYPLLDAAGGLMRTGPTGTNVNDLVVIVCR